MHHMQSMSPRHSPVHHTLTPLVHLILPISVISGKQTHMVKGIILHSGHIGIFGTMLWSIFEFNDTSPR